MRLQGGFSMKKPGLRKWIIVLALVVTLLPLLAIGALNYAGRRYASEIDDLLASLLEQDPTESSDAGPGLVETPPTGTEPSPSPPDVPPTSETPPVDPNSGEPVKPEPSSPPVGPAAPPGIGATDQQTAVAAFEQMNVAEKVTVLRTVSKFSTSEMLEYYKLYKQGDKEAIATIKSELKAKLTSDDYETIRQLAGKYR